MLVRGLFARCEGREHASDPDWCRVTALGSCRDIPEGTLMVAQAGERWHLYWCQEKVVLRQLAQGSRIEVENETREVVLFGLPGGPGAETDTADWWFDEGSLHRAATTGVFRLMLQPGGRGCLVFVRHDGAVLFLGQDQRDALIHTADQRLAEHKGAPLHAWFMGRRLTLRGLGVLGVVGQFELARDVRIALVRVEQDLYELYIATGRDAYDLIGVYTSVDLARGDLGGILVSGPAQRQAPTAHVPPPREPVDEPPTPGPSTTATPAPPPVTEEDLRRLATCLTLGVFVGEGSSAIKYIYAGFRILVAEGREDELFRSKVLRQLLEQTLKARIPGVHRTFMRALMRFLEMTGLGRLEGRRVRIFFGGLRRGDSEVVAMLRAKFVPAPSPEARSSVTPSPPTAQAAAPLTVAPPARAWSCSPHAAQPWRSPTPTPPAPPGAWSTTSSIDPPAAGPAVDTTVQVPDTAPPDASMRSEEEPADSAGQWRSTLRRDGPTYWRPIYTTPSLDDPSQFPGVKPRGPPKR
jgi:hypothetical protein